MKVVRLIFALLFLSGVSGYGILVDNSTIIPSAEIIASALNAGSEAMEVIAQNIANQYTTKDVDGNAYKTRVVSLEPVLVGGEHGGFGVRVSAIKKDESAGVRVFQPSHPHADENGFVEQSNVKVAQEMVKLTKYTKWMEAQYVVANASVKMAQNALSLGR